MEIAEMKSRIHHTVDKLPPDKLESLLVFLEDLQRVGDRDEWDRQDAGFFMKAPAESGDAVRLSGQEARKLADALVAMADRADKIYRTPEPMHA